MMRNWLLLSSSFHAAGLIAVIIFSSININIPQKKKQVFYVDFVGSSEIKNTGPSGQNSSSAAPAAIEKQPEPEKTKQEQPAKENKNELKIPEKKAAEKKSPKTAASPVKNKTQKKADKADYLQAEDFAGELPPPSMAAASGFLPEKKAAKGKSEGGQTVSEGIGGGGFRTDMDFPYPWYISQVREALFNAWAANSPAISGMQCTMTFTILRNGSIKNVKTEKSSGNRLFDSAAGAAVRASAPFSRLPDDFYEDVLTIHVEFKSAD